MASIRAAQRLRLADWYLGSEAGGILQTSPCPVHVLLLQRQLRLLHLLRRCHLCGLFHFQYTPGTHNPALRWIALKMVWISQEIGCRCSPGC